MLDLSDTTLVSPGFIVRVTRGKEAGRLFVVLAVTNSEYALIADGRRKRIAVAKKKKFKHLEVVLGTTAAAHGTSQLELTDAKVRKILSAYRCDASKEAREE